MGVGHVPAGPVPQERAGADLPGRQHRGAGAGRPSLEQLGRVGERIAERFLVVRGARVLARNLEAGGGEIDLLVRFDGLPVAVEVKTRFGGDPLDSFGPAKAMRVQRTAVAALGRPVRVDLVAVSLGPAGARVRWVPDC